MWIASSAVGRSVTGASKLITIGFATPTIEPSLGLIVGGLNGGATTPAAVTSGAVSAGGGSSGAATSESGSANARGAANTIVVSSVSRSMTRRAFELRMTSE